MDGWTAREANQLRELLGLKPEGFAHRLRIHQRTVIRWRDGETGPAAALWKDLDNLLIEAARKLAPWLNIDQLGKMNRRDILKLLAASTGIPLAGVDLLWNVLLTEVSNTSLCSFEDITAVLGSQYNASPSHVLLGSVTGHLEKASGLLRTAAMRPVQRQRLESTVADAAIFVGVLSMQTGKLAQADAHFELAEKMARQASNMSLLAQVLAEQALLDYYEQSPAKADDDPRPRIDLLEESHALAKRHAPPMVQFAISGWLAEDRAAAGDGSGAEEALEWSRAALEKGTREGASEAGFCSSMCLNGGWGQGRLERFRGSVAVALNPACALGTIEASLRLTTDPRGRAAGLVWLAKALIACTRPQEACDCLAEAYAIGMSFSSVATLHLVFGARVLMPTEWNRFKCVQRLDEQLGGGKRLSNPRA